MKIFKTILIVIIVLILLFFGGIIIFLKTVDINQFKSQMIGQLNTALGRETEIGRLDFYVSLRKGVGLTIRNIRIHDKPKNVQQIFLDVEKINLDVNLLAFLTKRQILVERVQVFAPELLIKRNADGEWILPATSHHPPTTPTPSASTPESTQPVAPQSAPAPTDTAPSKPVSLPEILIKSIELNDGIVVYVDKTFQPELKIVIPQINAKVTGFSLNKRFSFSYSSPLWSPDPNVKLDGTAMVDLNNNQARLDDVKMSLDLSQISTEQMMAIWPALNSLSIINKWHGMLNMTISQMIVGSQGLLVLDLEGRLSDGAVRFKELLQPIEKMNCSFDMNEVDLQVKDCSLFWGSGKIIADGRLNDYQKKGAFRFDTEIQKLRIEEMLADQALPVKVQGDIYGKFNMQGGIPHEQDFLSLLTGNGSVEVKEGKLIDFNVLRILFDQMSMIPDLTEKVENAIPEKYRKILNQKDTYLGQVEFLTKIQSGSAEIIKAHIASEAFVIDGKGKYNLDQTVEAEAAIRIPADLSQGMIAGVPELALIANETQEIYIPFAPYEGPAKGFRLFPDLQYLGERIIANRGREEINRIIDKALGNEEGQGNQNSPEKEIIGNILDSIFGK